MPTYCVTLPITGYVVVEVEADDEKDAIQVALESEMSKAEIEEWEVHEHIMRGNVCYANTHSAAAHKITD